MKWISIKERKPNKDGFYYWKGKGTYCGCDWYDLNDGEFDFNSEVARNKVDEEYLYWLDEEAE